MPLPNPFPETPFSTVRIFMRVFFYARSNALQVCAARSDSDRKICPKCARPQPRLIITRQFFLERVCAISTIKETFLVGSNSIAYRRIFGFFRSHVNPCRTGVIASHNEQTTVRVSRNSDEK